MNNILVIGLDKRGCDLIKFFKSKKLYGEINGYDLDFDVFKNAINKGLINNKEFDNFEKIIIRSDFIVLNISLNQYDTIFLKISSFVQKDCMITDINSSKEYIYKFKKKHLHIRKNNYIQSNCLFKMSKINRAINKKVLINSSISSNLESINRLSLFWRMYNFDTENMNVIDNDMMMSRVLHLPFVLKILFDKIVAKNKNETFFINLSKNDKYLFEEVLLNKNNIAKALNSFATLMTKLNFQNELSRVFFDKALKAREKLKKIYSIYKIEQKNEVSEGGMFNAMNFLLETLFVGEFMSSREYFYLNMDIFNFVLAGGEEFICLKTIENDKNNFLDLWNLLVDEIVGFASLLSSNKDLKVGEIIKYVEKN